MTNTREETAKRLELAAAFTENIKNVAEGVILVGSVAYAPNKSVTEQSDLDLVILSMRM